MCFLKNILFGKSLNAYCASSRGNLRGNNEDNFYFDRETLPEGSVGTETILHKYKKAYSGFTYYAVFDGMGGGDFGEIASLTAAKAAYDFLNSKNTMDTSDIRGTLSNMCDYANSRVFKVGNDLGAYQMGTTLVSFFFYKEYTWICNVGDSKGFRYRNGELVQLSKDHVLSTDLYHQKPSLSQFLGANPEELLVEPFINNSEYQKGDVFILCSDGLTDMVSREDIISELNSKENGNKKVEKMLEMALNAGGIDNITIILIEIK